VGKIIAVANQKGGVGKTTSCVNIAASLVAHQNSVLLIDSDPQGNATMGSGIDKSGVMHSINDLLLGEVEPHTALLPTKAGYDLIPANRDLTAAEVELLQVKRREYRLLQMLNKIKSNYDYIFIDCPPSLSMLTVNALVAADSVLIPIQCEYFALEGLTGLLETISSIRERINAKLQIEGLLRTMFDGRNRLATEVSQQLLDHFGKQVFTTIIPRNVRLAEAPSYGEPALLYDSSSIGAMAYLELAKELVSNKS
jgi:chromosome partitioning protein